MPARFDGKVALVIGGSSGIGLATVRGLLAEGGGVVIVARDAARLAAIGEEPLAKHPGRVAWVSGDISELGEAERFVAATLTRFGRLDILVTSSAERETTWPTSVTVATRDGVGLLSVAHLSPSPPSPARKACPSRGTSSSQS